MIKIERDNRIESADAVKRIEKIHETPGVHTERPKDQDSYQPRSRSKELKRAYQRLKQLLETEPGNRYAIKLVKERIIQLEEGNQPDKNESE